VEGRAKALPSEAGMNAASMAWLSLALHNCHQLILVQLLTIFFLVADFKRIAQVIAQMIAALTKLANSDMT